MDAYMEFKAGAILDGKVKTITKFGAFITLPEGKTGLVHISEIAYSYVNEVREFLTEGQEVRVLIVDIDPAGKINLSIKRAQPRPQGRPRERVPATQPAESARPKPPVTRDRVPMRGELLAPGDNRTFEDKLKAFMSEADSKIAGCRQYERKTKSRKR